MSRLFLLLIVAVPMLAGCSSRPLTFRIWPPERHDAATVNGYPGHWRANHPTGRKTVGLAFSGGGTMSASVSVGALRGLDELRLLDEVDYICGISGGVWGTLPYVFLNAQEARRVPTLQRIRSQKELERRYLGSYVSPERLTREDLTKTKSGSLESLVSNTKFSLPIVGGPGDEIFAKMLNGTFLAPLGLGDHHRYVCNDERQLASILARNPELGREHFYLPGRDKPFLITGMSLERKYRTGLSQRFLAATLPQVDLSDGYHPAVATPAYTGIKGVSQPRSGLAGCFEHPLGGFVETFGFDAEFQRWKEPRDLAVGRHRTEFPYVTRAPAFSLADMMAASGSAPAAMVGMGVDFLGLRPEFEMFNSWEDDPSRHGNEQPMVDGGACDNTGVALLLSHGVTNIVAFVNSAGIYDPELGPGSWGKDADTRISGSIAALFGKIGVEGREGSSAWRTSVLANAKTNHLLDDTGGRLAELQDALDCKAKSGRPLVYCADYRTSSQPKSKSLKRYGVEPGRPVRICWVLYSATDREQGEEERDLWFRNLTAEAREVFKTHHSDLKTFPEISVFFQNGLRVQELEVTQANALTHYSAHNVVTSAPEIRRAFRR